MKNFKNLGFEDPRYRDREKPPPPWLKFSLSSQAMVLNGQRKSDRIEKLIKVLFFGMIIASMIKDDLSNGRCQEGKLCFDVNKQLNESRIKSPLNLIQALMPFAQASSSLDLNDTFKEENNDQVQRKIQESFNEYEEKMRIRKIKKESPKYKVELSWKPIATSDPQEQTDSLTSIGISGSERYLQAQAPAPVIGSTLTISSSRAVGCNSYTISWSYTGTSSPSVDFDIQSLSGTWNTVFSNAASTTSKVSTFTDFKNYGYYFGTTISYRLRFIAAGFSYSNYYTGSVANILKQPPVAVTGLTFTQGLTSLTVSWTALNTAWTSTTSNIGTGNDAVSYQVQKCLSSSCSYGNWGAAISHPTSSISYTLPDTTQLNWNIAYRFRIVATNTCGSITSAESTYTILSSIPVTAMAAPTRDYAYSLAFKVAWTPLSTAADQGYRAVTSYELSYCLVGSTCNSYTVITTTANTFYEQTIKSPLNWAFGQTYQFRVRPYNGAGWSTTYSGILTLAMPSVAVVAPVLSLTSKSLTAIALSWTAVTAQADLGNNPFGYYRLQRSDTPAFSSITHDINAASVTSITLTKASYAYNANQWYYYRIAVQNQAGVGTYSTTLAVQTPTPPVKMAAPVAATVSITSIVIQWTRLTTDAEMGFDAITTYTLQKCTGSMTCTSWSTVGTYASSVSSYSETYTVANTPRGVITRYQIWANNGVGSGTASDALTFTTINVPTSMTAVTCSSVTSTAMTLTWPAVDASFNGGSAITFYGVEYSVSSSAYSQLNSDFSNLYLTYTYSNGATNFPANTVYSFRVRAKNGIDYSSVYSTVVTCTTPTTPSGMNTPTSGTVTPTSIVINWASLDDTTKTGRTPITYYKLEWYNTEITTAAWQEITSQANGLIYTFTHTRTSGVFSSGSSQQYRILAKNTYGYGTSAAYSTTLTVTADAVPIRMNAPTQVSVSPNQIAVQWTGISVDADTGRDNIIFYNLYWDKGKGTVANDWQALLKYPTQTTLVNSYTHTLTSGTVFTSNSVQNYKVCAVNGVGEGACGTLAVTADSVPLKMNTPTQGTVTPSSIAISWTEISTADTDTGRDPVIFYNAYWDKGKGVTANDWQTLISYPTSTTLITSITHTLTSGTIFATGSTQTYKVCAVNGVGEGACSTLAVTADQVPIRMNAPTQVAVNPNSIEIQWSPITADADTGRDDVIFYHVQWDQGLGSTANNWAYVTNYPTSTALTTSFKHTLSSGNIFSTASTQLYRVCAQNGVGIGACSSNLPVTADQVPTRMNTPAMVSVNPSSIQIQWSPITDETDTGRDIVIFYHVQWDQGLGSTANNWAFVTNYPTSSALTTSFTHQLDTGKTFPSASTQLYRVCAQNGVGIGTCSSNLPVTADSVPIRMNTPDQIISINPGQISISWLPITDDQDTGRDPVIFYHVQWDQGKGTTANSWINVTDYPTSTELKTSFTHTLNSGTVFASASSQLYRICASNGVGFGACGGNIVVTADSVPIRMNTPSLTSVSPSSISVQWIEISDEADTGRDPVIFYHVQWDQGKGSIANAWTNLTNYPTSTGIQTSFTHTLDTGNVFSSGSSQLYRICASNGVGYGACSSNLDVTADSVPIRMNTPTLISVAPNTISIQWEVITADEDTGRDPVIFYHVQWDQGLGEIVDDWVTLTDYPTSTGIESSFSHILSTGVFPTGSQQLYRICAQNSVGYGACSNSLMVTADQVPIRKNVPTIVSVDPNSIKIEWQSITSEEDTGRDVVIFYNVYWDQGLGDADANWSTLISYPTSTTLQTSHTHTLTTGNVYPTNSIQIYKVCAQNGVGEGACQKISVQADEVPISMSTVTVESVDPASIKFTWTDVILESETGRDPVIFYNVYWDKNQGVGAVDWETLIKYPTSTTKITAHTHTLSSGTVFNSGSTQRYNVCAQNGVGEGACQILEVTADSIPQVIDPVIPVENIYPQKVVVTWTQTSAADDGRDAITDYLLQWDQGNETWVDLNTQSNGMTTTYEHIPPSILTSGGTYKYRLYSKNGVGYSLSSTEVTIQADKVPQACNAPVVNEADDVDEQQIYITWTEIATANDGGDPVIFYLLEWDSGTTEAGGSITWTQLNSEESAQGVKTSYIHTPTSMFTPGATIRYRLTAKNGVDYGKISDETPVLCDTYPIKMPTPQVSMIRYNQIDLYWDQLETYSDTGRNPINFYRIEFFQRDCYQTSYSLPSSCTTGFTADDGTWIDLTTTVSTIITSKSHTTSTFFSEGKNFDYRVRANNDVGYGQYSDILTIKTPTRPTFMNEPTCDYIDPKVISISWVPLDNSTQFLLQGNDIITYYTLEVDMGSGFEVLNPTGSLIITKLHSSTTPFSMHTVFKYRVAATNGVGMGAYSSELSITTDTIPNAVPDFMKVSVAHRQIQLSWSALTDPTVTGRDPVTYYKLEYHDNKPTTTSWTELTSSTLTAVTSFDHIISLSDPPFPANINQADYSVKYRVSAMNGVEYGPTTEITVVTKTYPRKMNLPTNEDPIPTQIVINWAQLTTSDSDTGGEPIIHYQLEWIKQSDTSDVWSNLTSYPYIASSQTMTSFAINTWYRVRIAASNMVGQGIYSDEITVLTDDVPNRLQRMPAPTENSATNATEITIDWIDQTDVLDTGRDPVSYYRIYWDKGLGGIFYEQDTSPLKQFQLTHTWYNIQNGTTYKFKIRPQNGVGDDPDFDTAVLSLIPSSPPDRMATPAVTLIQADTMVKVTWTYPQDNGDRVNAYMVEFRAKDGTWSNLNDTCDGSLSTIISGKYCYVHMQKLREDPFFLVKNDKIVVRINAKNIKGYNNSASEATDNLFTVVIETEPDAPGQPIRGPNTDYNILQTSWAGISSLTLPAGGITSSITSYEIQRNIGNTTAPDPDSDTWISLQGFTSNNTNTDFQTSIDIVGGTTYQLRARAYNKYGWGAWSQIYSIVCAQVPDAPSWITIDNSTTNFLFKWHEPFNHGLSILRYYIAVQKKGTDSTKASNYIMSDDCPGDDYTINSTQICMIKMTTLRSTTYLYSLNDKVRVRIWAENLMGIGSATIWQTTSTGNNAKIQTQPSAPSTTVTNFVTTTTDLQIKISWAELPTTDSWGGIQIGTYEVWWYDPLTFTDYEILFTDTRPFKLTYTHTKTPTYDPGVAAREIIPGTLYKMKYRAINIHGEGSFSPETPIYASTLPDKLSPPVTSLTNTTVWIQWAPTPNDHSQAVTRYAIRFKASNGSFIEDSGCSGASPAIVSAMRCSMPMTKFTSSPFNLNTDTLIEVTLDAMNVMGWSGQSLPNTVGVTAKRLPQSAPTGLARGVNTGKNTMHLTWIGLNTIAQTGGQNVDYKIQYDRGTGSWTSLVGTTSNATSYQELNTVIFKTGVFYSFRVQAFNDFGSGPFSSNFGIWAAIPPTGLAAPSTSLNFNSYTEEDDIVVVDWDPPTDNGGLWTSYAVDIMAKSGNWVAVSVGTECYENSTAITDFKMPLIPAADVGTRCTLLVRNLKSKYQLLVGDIVQARVKASHAVGSVTSAGGGTAVLPIVPCFRTTFPRVFGGSNSNTNIRAMDVDDNGHIVVGGETQDRNLLEGKTVTSTVPMAAYIAKGNYYQWAKYFQTTDTVNSAQYQYVSDITFRWDGEKIALALDKINYDISYLIIVLNKDGTLYGAYREGQTNARAKVLPGGMIFDSSNMITVGLDFATDGTLTKRQAVINRFSVSQQTAGTFNTQFYLIGGGNANNIISQGFSLIRIRGDTSQFYFSALITDASGTRRGIVGKSSFTNGALQRNVAYSAGSDYNSDSTIGVAKRMNLDENDLLQQHIIAACIMSQDNYRIHFGEFTFIGTSLPTATVLTPNQLSTYNTYNCLGSFSRTLGTLFFLYNYRQNANPNLHQLVLGRVTTSTRRLDQLQISSHQGPNTYGGARFIHMSRFYYFGTTKQIHKGNTLTNLPMNQGWINLFDPLEWTFHCNPTSQPFTIPTGASITLDLVLPAQMDWKQTALTTTTGFANSVTRTMRSLGSLTGLFNLNLGEPAMNNTWCPIVTTGGAPTVTAPAINFQMFKYNPDAIGSQTQSFQFDPVTISRYCPDTVIYNLTYLSKTNSPLPSFITLNGDNNSYVYDVSTTAHVGTYPMALRVTLGNNQTSSVEFTTQVASPCLNNPVAIPTYSIPIYDLSEWAPKYVDLNWVVTNATPSCGSVYQIFQMVNLTNGGPIDPNIYTIVNQSNGIQRIQISTPFIPYAKLWTDLLINSYLQGDFVASKVFTINITNDCAPTVITPQIMPDWVYYTGRDSIDLTFVWTETIGKCGPISFAIREYLLTDTSSNNTLDSSIFTYPSVVGTNNTLKIFTADEAKVGTYRIRVYASLGIGGYKQSSTFFTLSLIRDPCAYYTFTVPFIDDLTLWINQTGQTVTIPFFKMIDQSWICNFTYVMTTDSNAALDPIFVKNQAVPQATNPTLSLVTTDKTKVDLSPYGVRIRGWPTRQPSSVALSLTFRIYIAYFDKTDCTPGKYYNSVTETCDPCTSPCSQCKDTPTKCTWCIDTHIFVENINSCIAKTDPCPSGIKDPYLPICRKCSEFCKTCSDYQTCTLCIPNYSLANKKCYPPRNCPEGFTYNGAGCTQCPTNCSSCVSSTVCNYCMTGSYLNTLTNQCVTNCPIGYYGDDQSRVCMLCAPACKTCVNNNYTCTSCKDVTANGVTTFKYLYGNTCVDRCPYLQFYQNHANRSCDPCNAACMICVSAFDDCIVCNKGSVISGRSCLNSCPAKSYITEIGTCFPCDPSCQICRGAMNSMCSECVSGQFLTQTTCEPKCNPPLYPDTPTKSCKPCLYYCNQCTIATDCQKCKTGYKQLPNNCEGEMLLRLNGLYQISVPIDASVASSNPRQMTTEIWFKIDNPFSLLTEVILGTSPYKLRKKASLAQVQISFDQINYCDSFNLKADQWYHYAYSVNEEKGTLFCYVNGERISTGLASVGIISADIQAFKEITFGGSIEMKTSESKFTGYVKEFRWWKVARTQFQIQNFKNIAFATAPSDMYAYWRLDEDRRTQTAFKESVMNALFTPTPPLTLSQIVEMREIYLKLCPEGFLQQFNETSNMAECIKCHDSCKNCNGLTNTSCTDCVSPYKLIEAEQKCIVVEGCPIGYFEDVDLQCKPCHEYCITCINTPTQCPKCKAKYFKQYRGLGCVDSCPRGLYGNYMTQGCAANPIVTSMFPEDSTIFSYGEFIDLYATFEVLNQEPRETYDYGWIISKLNSNIDLAKDATKPYFGTDITRVHLDNNILEPNYYYNITFFVKGKNTFYNGMLGSMYNVIYIGIPPKNGKCSVSPGQGIATVTQFRISTSGWVDVDGIGEYGFAYSFDNGNTFIPIKSDNNRLPGVSYIFEPVFTTVAGVLRCYAKSMKGFTATADAPFALIKKQSSSSKLELAKVNVSKVTDEKDAIQVSSQINSIARDLGKLTQVDSQAFDAKITADQCTIATCSYQGQCIFDQFSKKYYCKCNQGIGGVNCTFKNQTELEILRNKTLALAKLYNPMSLSGRRAYDYQFLNTVTSSLDIMTEDIHDAIFDIVAYQINKMKMAQFNVGDNQDLVQNMNIISNMLEFQNYNSFVLNQTGQWKNMSDAAAKKAKMFEDLNKTFQLINTVKNSTLSRLSFLQTEVSIQTRMVSFRQVLQTKDSILSMPATTGVKKQQQTYVKISPTNFINSSVNLNDQFIAEAVEYAINPYQLNNTDNVASNVFEVNIFNYNRTVDGGSIVSPVSVQNLTTPIEFAFPVSDNQNLTEFLTSYNQLNNFKYSDVVKKDIMVKKSNLSCVYWDKINGNWSKSGCQLQSLDKNHIKCNCTHLSAFTILFATPKLTVDAPLLENTTIAAQSEVKRNVTLKDIIKWPLDAYFKNMYKLWQHNRPSFISFIIKPGFAVLILFWAMYFSSLIYYSGQDDLKRFKMTKQQNRDDLAELKDDDVQNVMVVVRELIVKDFITQNSKFIQRESKRMKQAESSGFKKAIKPPQIKLYETMSKEEQKKYRKRARKKVFGMPGGLCDRAKRVYDMTMKHNTKNPNAKMSFFNDELKNNLWIGLIAKTSKIAPRHVRLVLMYFYSSLYITLLTLIFGFELQEYISDQALFQVCALAVALIIAVWIITIPVALIFRMPLHLRQLVAGVRTKKVNKAFQVVDQHMGWRYAIGYFICLAMFFVMTVVVLVFNIFYPHDYVMGWFFNIILIYILDMLVFTFALAAFQMVCVIASTKIKCFYSIWKAIEVFRYVKNLRG